MWVTADMGQSFLYTLQLFWAVDSDLFIPHLTPGLRAAHCSLVRALKSRQRAHRRGQRDGLKIAPGKFLMSSIFLLFERLIKGQGHYVDSSKMESRSVIQRQRISTGANLQADLNARVNRADHMKLIYMHSLMRPGRVKAGGLRVSFLF